MCLSVWVVSPLVASARIAVGYSGAKTSSAYSPPEQIFVDSDGVAHLKSFEVDAGTGEPIMEGLPYELLTAQPSHDAWALGMILYHIITGQCFLLASSDDNIGE